MEFPSTTEPCASHWEVLSAATIWHGSFANSFGAVQACLDRVKHLFSAVANFCDTDLSKHPQGLQNPEPLARETDRQSTMDNVSSSKFVPTEDQIFLLYLIMGIYFGPDLKDERPKKSALRRIAEGLQLYSPDQLAGTCFRTAELERLYYYVLRKADQSVILPLPLFYQFFNGLLPTPVPGSVATYRQLNDLFPPHLHPLRLRNGHNVIENIAFINDPDVNYVSAGYLEKFKKLTGLQHLLLDGYREGSLPFPAGETHDHNGLTRGDSNVQLDRALVGPLNSANPLACTFPAPSPSNTNSESLDRAMLVLPTPPSNEEWRDIVASTRGGYSITGSAANGQVGPVLGLVDIGESEDSYLFRVSLPGVKRDESEFSCEVEDDGTVIINGVTTKGEKIVKKRSQVFEMQSQNLCPSGHFSISFKLPGPVNPQQFTGNFGTDAILEGIVMKAEQN
nr:alpha-crystallin domain-containing protein 22.3-like [Ipomoea trifida]